MGGHRVFGIRHHGPGSARSLLGVLDHWQPDCILIEGPPEGDEWLPSLGDAAMVPPVALLAYDPDAPRRAVFYPFASFSPEWVAAQWGVAAGVPVRFMDLPLVHVLAQSSADETPECGTEPTASDPEAAAWEELCAASGFSDPEALWDRLVETQPAGGSGWDALFEDVHDLMAELRTGLPPASGKEGLREAHMRTRIRAALNEGHQRVAAVCGAWHAPALSRLDPDGRTDAALLKGLPRTKVATTWVPWTYGRLTGRSGYGAGVEAPGWYEHRFERHATALEHWITQAAAVFRGHGFPVSSAHAIEAVRLSRALAELRGYREPALRETLTAIEAVFCGDDPAPMRFVVSDLLVGERLGRVPDGVPEPALARSIKAEQKRLRLAVEPGPKELDLDLRQENARARSVFFHRLTALGIPWAVRGADRTDANTFHERWVLSWRPELSLAAIEAGRFGTTVPEATEEALRQAAARATGIPELALLLQQALWADAGKAVDDVAACLDGKAAGSTDVPALANALVALAPVLRYGDVRKTDTGALSRVLRHYAERVSIGLPQAACGISDEQADELSRVLGPCDGAVRTCGDAAAWVGALRTIAHAQTTHPLVAGRSTRLLLAQGAMTPHEASSLMSQALSPGVAADQSRWLEGLLQEGGQFLIHHPELLQTADAWLRALSVESFEAVLPVLRRGFSALSAPERRHIGTQIQSGSSGAVISDETVDWSLVLPLVPFLARIFQLERVA